MNSINKILMTALIGLAAFLVACFFYLLPANHKTNDTVAATIGNYQISLQTVDNTLLNSVDPSQLYDLRRNVINSMIDNYKKVNPDDTTKPIIHINPPRFIINIANHPVLGNSKAPITLVEFADFQCPYCKVAEPVIKQLQTKYPNKIKLVYFYYPLTFHNNAINASIAAECASEQGKFWQYHDQLFADPNKLDIGSLKNTAKDLKLNTTQFNNCLGSKKTMTKVVSDKELGDSLGVSGTPSFFINGRKMIGIQPLERFSTLIDEELAVTGK